MNLTLWRKDFVPYLHLADKVQGKLFLHPLTHTIYAMVCWNKEYRMSVGCLHLFPSYLYNDCSKTMLISYRGFSIVLSGKTIHYSVNSHVRHNHIRFSWWKFPLIPTSSKEWNRRFSGPMAFRCSNIVNILYTLEGHKTTKPDLIIGYWCICYWETTKFFQIHGLAVFY